MELAPLEGKRPENAENKENKEGKENRYYKVCRTRRCDQESEGLPAHSRYIGPKLPTWLRSGESSSARDLLTFLLVKSQVSCFMSLKANCKRHLR